MAGRKNSFDAFLPVGPFKKLILIVNLSWLWTTAWFDLGRWELSSDLLTAASSGKVRQSSKTWHKGWLAAAAWPRYRVETSHSIPCCPQSDDHVTSCHTFIQFLELKTMNSIDKKPPLPKKKHALPRRLTTETRISTERLPRGPTPTISQSSARTRKCLRVEMSRAEVLEHPCVCNSSPSLFFLPRPQAAPSAMHQQAKVWRPIWSRTERFTMNACYKWPSKLQKAALTIRNCSTRSFFVSLPVRCCKYGSSPVCAWWLLVLTLHLTHQWDYRHEMLQNLGCRTPFRSDILSIQFCLILQNMC